MNIYNFSNGIEYHLIKTQKLQVFVDILMVFKKCIPSILDIPEIRIQIQVITEEVLRKKCLWDLEKRQKRSQVQVNIG